MAKNVNVYITNWRWAGQDVPTPQAKVDVEIKWIKNDGTPGSWSGTATFPNDLQDVPVAWMKEELTDLLLRVARIRLGIDEVGQ